jgi:hypothetical protein
MGGIVIRTRYDEGTESAEVATSDDSAANMFIYLIGMRKNTLRELQQSTYTFSLVLIIF